MRDFFSFHAKGRDSRGHRVRASNATRRARTTQAYAFTSYTSLMNQLKRKAILLADYGALETGGSSPSLDCPVCPCRSIGPPSRLHESSARDRRIERKRYYVIVPLEDRFFLVGSTSRRSTVYRSHHPADPGRCLKQDHARVNPREFQSLLKDFTQSYVAARRGAARRLSFAANERSMVSAPLEVSRENTDWRRGCRRCRFPVSTRCAERTQFRHSKTHDRSTTRVPFFT